MGVLLFISLGDFRTNENVALAGHQTLWVREHNRMVDILRGLKPNWKQEKLFQVKFISYLYIQGAPYVLGRFSSLKTYGAPCIFGLFAPSLPWLTALFNQTRFIAASGGPLLALWVGRGIQGRKFLV